MGRFINADALVSTGGLLGNNMFACCLNNPVNYADPYGTSSSDLWPDPFYEWLHEKIKEFKEDLEEDSETPKDNTNEQDVLDANYYSYYKGVFVLKLPIGKNAAFFGIIFLGDGFNANNGGKNVVRHEYGHSVQLVKLGFQKFTYHVAIPSVVCNLLDRMEMLPGDYFSYPWEYQADQYGGVTGRKYESWAQARSDAYYYIIEQINDY